VRVVSVNVSRPIEVQHRGRSVRTGIFKMPVSGSVRVGRTNLDGDEQADLRVHGGPDKAVYLYPAGHYPYWEKRLGRSLPYGQFGENLTVEGMDEETAHIGDVFRIGTALAEISEPRAPCFKLGIKMGSPRFLRPFLESGRTGFYLRVLQEGFVAAGDLVELVSTDSQRVTVLNMVRLLYSMEADRAGAEKALGIRTLSGWLRSSLQERLAASV
jgi:MOSC domain-containing protein YiiM